MDNINKYLPSYKGCMICGNKTVNPHTLSLRFRITDEGVETPFVSDYKQEGYKGVVHGGIIASILDETIGWAVAVAQKKYFMTVELNIRFQKPLPVGKEVLVKGRPISHKRRSATGEGLVIDAEGTVYAKASARFFLMPDEKTKSVHDYMTFREDDVNILK